MHKASLALMVTCLLVIASGHWPGDTTVHAQTQLRIVVIDGEDAVNIIQQKTAVAPVVEVRDRNDQPVAGAIVSFTIRRGRATFGGARTLTVSTNATGRALGTGLTPTGSGALQIGASASYQGQTAAITIAQTNVATAAEAVALTAQAGGATGGAATGASVAGTAAAAGGAAVGGAAAAGAATAAGGTAAAAGGISAVTVGAIGGAVAGGAIVATRVVGGGDAAVVSSTYRGDFNISTTLTITFPLPSGATGRCTSPYVMAGTITMTVDETGRSNVNAHIDMNWTEQALNPSCPQPAMPFYVGLDYTGSGSSLQFARTDTGSGPNGFTITRSYGFTGSVAGGAATGTVSLSRSAVSPTNSEVFPLSSAAVTLAKQ